MPPRHDLSGLGTTLAVVLWAAAVAGIGTVLAPGRGLGLVLGGLLLMSVVVFLIWFYQARQNAGWSDWPQRLAPAWAIWGWFVPIIFLWFPFMVMAGIWRAGQPGQERARPAVLPGAWWACWLLAWFTGFRHVVVTTGAGTGFESFTSEYGLYFEGTVLSKLFAAAAAVFLGLIVRRVSTGPVGGVSQPGER
jgi:Domain of unknown function (DUF4328)